MALPNITFIKGQGGLGRALPGQDYISGQIYYCDDGDLPSGFSTTTREKTFYSVADAETAGILDDYSDATASTATFEVTAVGANGDTLKLTVADLNTSNGASQTTELFLVEKTASETTVTLLAVKIKNAINAGTQTHGYSATNSSGTVTITAPKSMGIYLNTGTPYVKTIVGTATATLVQNVVAGAASLQSVWHYHISEFFRMSPKGVLNVGFYEIPSTYTFTEITTLQAFAAGKIRQVGIYKDDSAYASGDITAINTVCLANDANKRPLSALYAGDLSGTADISTLGDLSLLTANKVSVIISQDGGGLGYFLWLTTGKSISNLGALLGTVALSKVSDSVAWVGQFNVSNGSECEVISFSNGVATEIGSNLLESMNTKRYIFLLKFVDYSGSYFNDSHTAIAQSSDYAYIENNRTIDKATRVLYSAYLPYLNSPISLNADGTLTDNQVASLESVGQVALDAMLRAEEVSATQVLIDPSQNILATSELVIAVTLVIKGVARYIVIPIGFKPQIS